MSANAVAAGGVGSAHCDFVDGVSNVSPDASSSDNSSSPTSSEAKPPGGGPANTAATVDASDDASAAIDVDIPVSSTTDSVISNPTSHSHSTVSDSTVSTSSPCETSDASSTAINPCLKDEEENLNGDGASDERPISSDSEIADKAEPPSSVVDVGISRENGKEDESSVIVDDDQSIYQIKWTKFHAQDTPIVTQNENGPCPLLAIVNVLLMRGKMKIKPGTAIIPSGQLMSLLCECILVQTPQHISAGDRLNYEKNMNDALAVIHKLQTGLDVNVKFTGVSDFEYTIESIIFDLLNISLYHGWLVDPQSPETEAALGNYSYNQIVERIISNKSSPRPELVTEALIAEEFLESTRSQLSYHGICELHNALKEGELAVFFRNNHFSTIYKQKSELFLLVTDQGFVSEPNVMWETLANVEGDGLFVNPEFRTYTPPASAAQRNTVTPAPAVAAPAAAASSTSAPASSPSVEKLKQIDADLLVALSMQNELDAQAAADAAKEGDDADEQDEVPARPQAREQTLDAQELADRQLALALQQEEEEQHAAAVEAARGAEGGAEGGEDRGSGGRRAVAGSPDGGGNHERRTTRDRDGTSPSGTKKDKDCVIL